MTRMTGWMKALIVMGAALTATACSTYPDEPYYSTRPMTTAAPPARSAPVEVVVDESPPATAPVERIEGGALPPPASSGTYSPPSRPSSPLPPPAYNPPPARPAASVAPGAAYQIQPGDTISGVGRRFQTSVQTLIDLNGLGPRATISAGQSIILPDSAVDGGSDPYATGPSPRGVVVPEDATPPPPPPPAARPSPPPPGRRQDPPPPVRTPPPPPAASLSAPGAVAPTSSVSLQWPVRGDIVRRFGPVGVGERNNGVNIAAAAGEPVVAAAAGRVAYVGDDLVGQGLTVLIVHREGWRTVYGHLGSATVDDGAEVRQGQQIGTVGLTAGDGRPSIHFETRRMQADDPVAIDPLTVLPR